MNYYKFFGVSDDAKKMEIRRVANNLALANHPDKCPDRDDAKCIAQRKEKMIIINEVHNNKHKHGRHADARHGRHTQSVDYSDADLHLCFSFHSPLSRLARCC